MRIRERKNSGEALIRRSFPAAHVRGTNPRYKPAVQKSTAKFDGTGHRIRKQDRTALWFGDNARFHGRNYSGNARRSQSGPARIVIVENK